MNFYAEQDQARRYSKWLLILFVIAVFALIAISNIVIAVTLWLIDGQLAADANTINKLVQDAQQPLSAYFSWSNFGQLSLWISSTIAVVIGFKWLTLRRGGKAIAEALGGTRIDTNTDNAEEQVLLNVVAEMAIASGMPVPPVYLLKSEKGINAFAAGHTSADAVIGITQGALEQFNREQLQGVVAHEFSHILNGDMRLNLQLIALLSGIIFIANSGEFVMRASGGGYGSRRSADARLFVLGLTLFVLGWLGNFFASLIKAAISRQREFLADASAVQFTRNPNGIADALKIIGGYNSGSRVFSANALETSHLFISDALGIHALFSTHPPLPQRIAKIQPGWNGQMIAREMKITPQPAPKYQPTAASSEPQQHLKRQQQAAIAAAANAAFLASRAISATHDSGKESPSMPSTAAAVAPLSGASQQAQLDNGSALTVLTEQSKDPFGASAMIYTLLLDNTEAIRQQQLGFIAQTVSPDVSRQAQQLYQTGHALERYERLALVELAIPTLKQMSSNQYQRFKRGLLLVMRADKHFSLFEWCLFQILRHYLAAEFETAPLRHQHRSASEVTTAYQQVLSALAMHGHDGDDDYHRAFYRGANTAGYNTITPLDRDAFSLDSFSQAAHQLAQCLPLIKPKLLKGLIDCARHDGEINAAEREIIIAMAAVMDCPAPGRLTDIP